MNTFKIDGRKVYQSFTNDQGVKILVIKQDKGVFFTDCKTDSSYNTGDTTKQAVEAMVNKFMNGEVAAEPVAAQAIVTLDGRKALQTFETNDGYTIDVIKSGRAYTVQVCYKGKQSDAYTPVINGSLIQAQEIINEMMAAIDDSNDDSNDDNADTFNIIDKYLDVEGMAGNVTLYFNAYKQFFVALDSELSWHRYKLVKSIDQLNTAQKTAILEYSLGCGASFNADLDVTLSDVFKHGEYIELIASDKL